MLPDQGPACDIVTGGEKRAVAIFDQAELLHGFRAACRVSCESQPGRFPIEIWLASGPHQASVPLVE